MKTLFALLIALSCFALNAQRLRFGIGLNINSFTPIGNPQPFVTDSIFFGSNETFDNPLKGPIRGDPRLSLNASYQLIQRKKLGLDVGIITTQHYPQMWIGRILDHDGYIWPYSIARVFNAMHSVILPVEFTFRPFRNFNMRWPLKMIVNPRFELFAGLGTGFHWIKYAGEFSGQMLLDNDRYDEVLVETNNQFSHSSHRNITMNYTLGFYMKLVKSFGLRVVSSGSIGSVTRPFNVFGDDFSVPVKRRGLSFVLTYDFDLSKKTNDIVTD